MWRAGPARRAPLAGKPQALRLGFTLAALMRRFPGVSFVWLMGSDNLADFHRWKHWRAIAKAVPMAVVPRPGYSVRSSPAARSIKVWRLHAPLNDASSTALRARARLT